MSALFMLDTNIISAALRHPLGQLSRHLGSFDATLIATSSIVASEMRYGAQKKGSPKLIDRVEDVLGWISVLPYDDTASRHFAEIRAGLEKRGRTIGWGDYFIAAHARSLGLTLVTDNIREFSRVDGLKLENWLEREAPDAGN